MNALFIKFLRIGVYLASVAGLCVLCAQLSSHVGAQAIAFATPYLAGSGPRPLSLVERRQIEAVRVAVADAQSSDVPVVLTAPSTPSHILAAQLDLSEQEDLKGLPTTSRRVTRVRSLAMGRTAGRSAGDVFGRSFGVLTVASR